ncbi:MAG: 4Fe-4S binding protein, partial [Chloroflexota bacterium]
MTNKVNCNLLDHLIERNPSVDWRGRLNNPVRRVLNWFERISLLVEKPIGWIVGDARFNPLYHTGTITVFLLGIILITGLYLTMFYPFGFTLSYEAVSKIEANLIGRFMRALHRYASDAAVIFGLLHAWRTFFQDRFRGPRWLAWTTGVGMAFVVWFIGVTGYWLIWDNRAQILNQTLFELFGSFKAGEEFIVKFMVGREASSGWAFMFSVILLHVGLSGLVGLFLWWHLKRMSRAKWLPPRYWMIITFALLGIAALLFPVGMLPPVNPTQLPDQSSIDLFYLFYLPAALRGPTALFWSAVLVIVALITLVPWILPRKKIEPVKVDLSLCDGCTLCERDCPYTAIKMIPRTDGARPKWEATIDPRLCVACGVCLGSCPENALTFGDIQLDPLWQSTLAQVSENKATRVIFTCERHALHGARNEFEKDGALVVPLTCIAMANPKLAERAIENGASEVQFVGCPPEDCANREGNLWTQQRLKGDRLPKLKPAFAPSVHMDWLAPTDFKRAFTSPQEATAYNFTPDKNHLRFLVPLCVSLIALFAGQIWLSDRPYQPFSTDTTIVAINMTHHSGFPLKDVP